MDVELTTMGEVNNPKDHTRSYVASSADDCRDHIDRLVYGLVCEHGLAVTVGCVVGRPSPPENSPCKGGCSGEATPGFIRCPHCLGTGACSCADCEQWRRWLIDDDQWNHDHGRNSCQAGGCQPVPRPTNWGYPCPDCNKLW